MVRSHSLYPIELRGLQDHSTAENLVRRVRHSAHAGHFASEPSFVGSNPGPRLHIQKGYFVSERESGEASACKAGLIIVGSSPTVTSNCCGPPVAIASMLISVRAMPFVIVSTSDFLLALSLAV